MFFFVGPAAWGKFEKDQIVSINLTNNKASIAVGKTCHSSMDMYMAAGRLVLYATLFI